MTDLVYAPVQDSEPENTALVDDIPANGNGNSNAVLDLCLTNSDLMILAGLVVVVIILFLTKVNALSRRVDMLEALLRR